MTDVLQNMKSRGPARAGDWQLLQEMEAITGIEPVYTDLQEWVSYRIK